jgi:hypothetical protein
LLAISQTTTGVKTMKDPMNQTVLAALLAQRGVHPQHAAVFSERLQVTATRLKRLAVRECNEGSSTRIISAIDRLRVNARAELKKFAEWNEPTRARPCFRGLALAFGGDPRGYVVHMRGLKGNTWGGDDQGFGL